MNLKTYLEMQIRESQSDVNRYFFWLKHKREPKDQDELMMFYIESGGAKNFADKHKGERQ